VAQVVDICCGGGIYAKSLINTRVSSVTGGDFSQAMIEGQKKIAELIQKEVARRHSSQVVIESLKEVGFHEIKEITLWEQDRFIPIRSSY